MNPEVIVENVLGFAPVKLRLSCGWLAGEDAVASTVPPCPGVEAFFRLPKSPPHPEREMGVAVTMGLVGRNFQRS